MFPAYPLNRLLNKLWNSLLAPLAFFDVLFNMSTRLLNSFLPASKFLTKSFTLFLGTSFISSSFITSSNFFVSIFFSKSPPTNKSFIFCKKISLLDLVPLSPISWIVGNIPSKLLVILLIISFALLESLAFNPCLSISLSKISWVILPLGWKGALIYLSIALWNADSL